MSEITPELRAMVDAITAKLADEGKIVEAGWQGMRLMVLPPNASAVQVSEMRKAFFMGAQHLYASIMSFMEEGEEPTDQDMDRMNKIHNELEAFRMDVTTNFKAGNG